MIISTAWSSNGANANIVMGEAEKIYMHVHLFFYISRFIFQREPESSLLISDYSSVITLMV